MRISDWSSDVCSSDLGSGFAAVQPGVTWLYASDPVVFFGSFSYLHNFKREDVSRTVLTGAPEGFPQTTTEFIGEVDAGDIIGFNIGVGLALNERRSEEHTSELQSLMRISYAVFCLKKKTNNTHYIRSKRHN